MKARTANIWVHKYRPTHIADIIFQNVTLRDKFNQFVEAGDIQHLLLSGAPGTGKTSVSEALINDLKIDPMDVLKINCSSRKIEAIRGDVQAFCYTAPRGDYKVVRLEEADYLSLDAQALLRSLIEEVQEHCRFIITCNYVNRLMPPLRDRFQTFVFHNPDRDESALHLAEILEKEAIEFDPDDIFGYVDAAYPSVRSMVQLIQQNSSRGKLLPPSSAEAQASDWKLELLDLVANGKWTAARTLVCKSTTKEEHSEIYTFMYHNAERLKVNNVETAILEIADHMVKHTLADDTEVNLAACFIKLSRA